jgi:hypothetical protein
MALEPTRVAEGLEVCGLNGERLGTVYRVCIDRIDGDRADMGKSGYIQISLDAPGQQDPHDLYVPFSAISTFDPGERLQLDFSYRADSTCYRVLGEPDEW